MNELTISIEAEPWFKELIDDLDGLWEEGRFTAAWTTVCFIMALGRGYCRNILTLTGEIFTANR